ncbi:metallophosphoesterase family protein [Allobranchiibius huperziae]|uniref:Calcineurin-like phosphoesterase family protein n=1 Tax=Allobranchiibius huperziae TaxID=1874116 RepID=A0A853D6V8_9MICO|nr:metallophosphoesterase [Allobranchiibius huperziae]NYJ73116.1 calcineurin-like phosphoesterase family protein [Allobranchiibius huperziae]
MARLLHLSDTHLLGPGSTSPHPDIDPEDRLIAVLSAATAEGPFDAVVVTGDISDDGSGDAVRRVHDLVRPLAPIVVAVPGNHDDTDVVAQVFGTALVRVGAWTIRGAATNVPGEVAGRADPVLDLLGECDGPTVVLMHHPVRSRSAHPWFTLRGAAALEQRLRDHRTPMILLSGHLHQPYEDTVGGVRLYGAPATFYGIAHDGEEWTPHGAPTGALIVDLGEDGTSSARLIDA